MVTLDLTATTPKKIKNIQQAAVPELGTLAPDFGLSSYHGSGRLRGLTAVVTGADSGIGRAAALAFAREGCGRLVLTSLDSREEREDLVGTVAAIEEQGGENPGERGTSAVAAVSRDLADEGFRVAVVEAAAGKIRASCGVAVCLLFLVFAAVFFCCFCSFDCGERRRAIESNRGRRRKNRALKKKGRCRPRRATSDDEKEKTLQPQPPQQKLPTILKKIKPKSQKTSS